MKHRKLKKALALSFVFLALAVLYIPIVLLIVYSFTQTKSGGLGNWGGFTLELYGKMLQDAALMTALGNTLLIAAVSALAATLIGTVSAVGIFYLKRRAKSVANTMNQIIVVNADVVTAVAFMMLFVVISFRDFGYVTLIIAHTMITIPFVIMTISPRMGQLNPNVYDAGLDLGAGPVRTLFTVVIPQLIPSMIASFAMVDDFVVTKFNNGGGRIDTLSTFLYNSLTKGARSVQELRALSALIFVAVFVILLAVNISKNRRLRREAKRSAAANIPAGS